MDEKILEAYIPLLAQSLRLPKSIKTRKDYADYINNHSPSRDGYGWYSRVERWRDQNIKIIHSTSDNIQGDGVKSSFALPIFPQMWARAVERASEQTQQEPKVMLESTKNTVNKVIDQNKEAGYLAAELSVGRTANEFILAKLVKTLPWYKRIFVGKEGNSWLGKLIVAQTVNAVVQQTSGNLKLQKIAGAMLKESVVEATVYSDQLTSIIQGLEDAVSLPHLDKLMGKDTK